MFILTLNLKIILRGLSRMKDYEATDRIGKGQFFG